jgi:phosphate transport system permease protein
LAATLPAGSFQDKSPMERTSPPGGPQSRRRVLPWADQAFSVVAHSAAIVTLLLLVRHHRVALHRRDASDPRVRLRLFHVHGMGPGAAEFGGLVMIYGTLMTSIIALLIAVPVSFGIAVFLTELSPNWLKRPWAWPLNCWRPCRPSSMACGACWCSDPSCHLRAAAAAGRLRRCARARVAWCPGPPVGIGILSAGIILAIMVIPFIAAVMRDVFEVTPAMLKESAYGLGSTTWEVVYRSCCPTPRPVSSAPSCWAWAVRWARPWL